MKKSRWSFISKVDVYAFFFKFKFSIHFTKLVKIEIFISYKPFRWNNIESEEFLFAKVLKSYERCFFILIKNQVIQNLNWCH